MNFENFRNFALIAIIIFFSLSFFFCEKKDFNIAKASTIEDLKEKIDDKNNQIAELEKEIQKYQDQINETGKQSATLQNAIKTLEISRNKLLTDIKLTQNRIDAANLNITELDSKIKTSQEKIEQDTASISAIIRKINESDGFSFIENSIMYEDFSILWNEIESFNQLQNALNQKIAELKSLKEDLESNKIQSQKKKNELESFQTDLSYQKKIVEDNKQEKNTLLVKTKNQEANYKKILEQKKAQQQAFEDELAKFESELRLTIDPKSIPPAGKGILAWPLDSVFITQNFGQTAFSKTVSVYGGAGHNGVDFRAAPGTRVKAAMSGVVEGTGNTDISCPGISFGKWVFIKHPNGLSTLYGHLSAIKVSSGQKVSTGDIIGYSGNTGYSTGPHLHFTVYASQGVQIIDRKSSVCGTTFRIPVADPKAYLNPLIYL